MSEANAITVDVVSDVVCPWCFIGQKRLDKAIAAAGDVEVHIRWRPFQLDPTIPPQGKDRHDYMLAKFGSDERIREIHARIEPLGEAEGISFAFDAIKVAPNTLDAHRLIRWAGAAGEDVQNRLVRHLFQLNFEEGANIGDHTVLVEAAREAGMDAAVVETLLPSDADVEAVRTEIHRVAHGHHRRAVLPARGQICRDGCAGCRHVGRCDPSGRGGQGAWRVGENRLRPGDATSPPF
nr:DsbA family protein [Mesorhizobium sp. CO1-1-9]